MNSEIIALLAEGGVLRGVKFVPRGRDGWARTGGGVWPAAAAKDAAPSEPDAEGAEAVPEANETTVEADKPLTRALVAAQSALGVRRVVLALPLSHVLVRVLKMPLEVRDDIADAVALQMDKLSPFPGEELAVGCEVLCEGENHLWVFTVALPAAVSDGLGAALREARLQVIRTDVAVLGWLRSLSAPCQLMRHGRRVVLMNPDGVWDLLVLDDGVPVLVRGLGAQATVDDVARDLTLSLLNVELEAGRGALVEVLVVSKDAPPPEFLDKLRAVTGVDVRHAVPPSDDGGVEGVALRTGEGASLDLTPQAWRDEIRETHFRKQMMVGVGIALSIWAVFMGVLFAGPLVYRQLTARERAVSKTHFKAHKSVSDTRERVRLIESYTDRSYSSLEMLRTVSGYLPDGITLVSFAYKRNDGVKVKGEADQSTIVYDFKDAVTEDPLFDAVNLTGPTVSRGKHTFDVDAKFKGSEDKQ
jgi:hypothetical protein